MDEEKTKKEEQPADDTGEGNQQETTKIIERQSERIKELESERDKRIIDDAKKQMGGETEGGKPKEKAKEETPHEYRLRVDKELAEGKTEFGN